MTNKTDQYDLLTTWADYLSSSTLSTRNQCVFRQRFLLWIAYMTLLRSSADGLSTNNQTNLAIKGIIAIQAMSKMSSIVHQTADVDKYFVRETFSLLVSVIN